MNKVKFITIEGPDGSIEKDIPIGVSADNQDYFSEWSSICLIKPISTPQLQ